MFPPGPEWKEEAIGGAYIPHIGIALRAEGAAVAGDEAEVIAEVVVQSEVEALRVDTGEVVAATVRWKEPLHSSDELHALEEWMNG